MDRNARGQGQKCSRPRTRIKDTGANVLQKKGLQIFFQAISQKNVFKKFFSGDLQKRKTKKVFANFPRGFWRFQQNPNGSKNSAVLEPRTGQFLRTSGFESKPKDLKMCPRGRPRGQGHLRGLHL